MSGLLAMLGQLAGAIAHEVRNPLAIIRSSVQNLEETLFDHESEARKTCRFVIDEIDRLTKVCASLLGFVRQPVLKRRRVSVGELFDKVELLAAGLLAKKRSRLVRIKEADAPEPLALDADADLLCQALLGLVSNAAEAAPERIEIVLEAVRTEDSGLEIAVLDSGPGVAPELRAKVFEPFFTTRSDGHGLGLAIVKQIVESHGGRVEIGERQGGGARVSFKIPAERRAA